jgi:hypothetical protein
MKEPCVAFKRKPTEPNLFSHACLIAQVVQEHKLVPRWYMDLLQSAVRETPLWQALGRDGVRRTIERAFEQRAKRTSA